MFWVWMSSLLEGVKFYSLTKQQKLTSLEFCFEVAPGAHINERDNSSQ